MSKAGIYQIRNLLNGKIYIGGSVNISQRWSGHRSTLRKGIHRNGHLQNAWNKYGEDEFIFEVLEEVYNVEDVLFREQMYLDNYRPDYNISLVAESNQLGRPLSEEHKKKISEGKKRNAHLISGENAHFWGKHHTEETKEKIRKSRIGMTLSDEHKRKITEAQQGEKSHYAKITEDDVREVRRIYATGDYSQREVGEMFGISQMQAGKIILRRSWKHVK